MDLLAAELPRDAATVPAYAFIATIVKVGVVIGLRVRGSEFGWVAW